MLQKLDLDRFSVTAIAFHMKGHPACHPKTAKPGGPVAAADVRSPAAAPNAADSSAAAAAAAAARPPFAEFGLHAPGQRLFVSSVIWTPAVGCMTSLPSIPGLWVPGAVHLMAQQRVHPSAGRCFREYLC